MNYNENVFNNIDSEEAAYWLGFIHADGHINKRSLEIELKSQDYKHLIKFSEFIKKDKNPKVTFRNKQYPTCRINIGSKKLCDNLRNIAKSINIINFIPEDFIFHFLRGLFDGDGSIGKDRIDIIGFTPVIEKIKEILDCGRIEYECYKGISRIYIYGLKRGKALNILHKLYDNASIFLDRKYIQYQNLLSPTSK